MPREIAFKIEFETPKPLPAILYPPARRVLARLTRVEHCRYALVDSVAVDDRRQDIWPHVAEHAEAVVAALLWDAGVFDHQVVRMTMGMADDNARHGVSA